MDCARTHSRRDDFALNGGQGLCHEQPGRALMRCGGVGQTSAGRFFPRAALQITTVISADRAKRDARVAGDGCVRHDHFRRIACRKSADRLRQRLFQLTGRVGISKAKTDPPPGRGS